MCWTHAKLRCPPVGCRTASVRRPQVSPLPSPQVEGRVSEDEIEFLGLVQVLEERVGIMIAQIRVDAADREVHGRHFPRGRIGLLAVHGDVVNVALMAFDEVRGLYEHAAAAAARIVHSPRGRVR